MSLDLTSLQVFGSTGSGAFVLFCVGLSIGFVSAIFGVGGGFFITPFLHSVVNLSAIHSAATSMGQIPFMSLSGSLGYLRRRLIVFSPLWFFLGGSLLSSQILVYLMGQFKDSPFQREVVLGQLTLADILLLLCFGFFIGLQGIYNIHKSRKSPARDSSTDMEEGDYRLWKLSAPVEKFVLILGGLLAGAFSVLLGIGGGFFSFPIFVYVIGMTPAHAVATGLFALFLTSSLAVLRHIEFGTIYSGISLLLAAGSIPGAWLGSRFAVRLQAGQLLHAMGFLQIGIVFLYWFFKLRNAF